MRMTDRFGDGIDINEWFWHTWFHCGWDIIVVEGGYPDCAGERRRI
ncbi:hypothetical protein [Methanococcoides methylutens]|nr:hypothetical protein [Methanococcoides methylutens]